MLCFGVGADSRESKEYHEGGSLRNFGNLDHSSIVCSKESACGNSKNTAIFLGKNSLKYKVTFPSRQEPVEEHGW